MIILSFWILFSKNNDKAFVKSFNYNSKTITIIIYDKIDQKKVYKKINGIYKNYSYDKLKSEIDLFLKDNDIPLDDSVDDLASSYLTKKVIDYFKGEKIEKYIINENGNITAGKRYSDKKYMISLNIPDENNLIKVINLENEALAIYNSKNMSDTYENVVIISDDNFLSSVLVYYLQSLNIEDGKRIAQMYSSEILWQYNNEIIITDNFKKYIL